MTMKYKIVALATTALVMMAGPVLAFTPNGELMNTSDSAVSNTWQPMVAQDGDGINDIAIMLYGPNYTREQGLAVIREFIKVVNQDKFPVSKIAAGTWEDKDAWLMPGVTYMVPVRADVAPATAAPAQAAQPAGQTVEQILTSMSGQQQATAADLATLSSNFAALAIDNIDGLAGRLTALDQSINSIAATSLSEEKVAAMRTSLSALEEAFAAFQNGELTNEMLTTVQTVVNESLVGIKSDIESLKAADIKFEERLTNVESTASTALGTANQAATDASNALGVAGQAKTDAEKALVAAEKAEASSAIVAFWSSTWGLLSLACIILAVVLMAIVFGRWGKASRKDVAKLHDKETGLDAVRKTAETTNETVVKLADRMTKVEAGLDETKQDVRHLAEEVALTIKPGDVDWTELTQLGLEDRSEETFKLQEVVVTYQGQKYPFQVGRKEGTRNGSFDTNIVRNKDSQQVSDPIGLKRMKVQICKAMADGRIPPRYAMAAE